MAGSNVLLGANFNAPLTNFALAQTNNDNSFVADRIAPIISTPDLEGTYFQSLNLHQRRTKTKRASGSPAVRITNDYVSKNYNCFQHSAAEEITKERKVRAEKAGFDVNEEGTITVLETMKIDREFEVAELIQEPTQYAAVGNLISLSGANRWNQSTATPFTNIQDARQRVVAGCGKPANVFLMPYNVWLYFSNNAEFLARLSSLGIKEPSLEAFKVMLGKELMPFDDIIVTPATYNKSTSKVSETPEDQLYDFIWGKSCVIARIEKQNNVSKKINTAFGTFSPEGFLGLQIGTRYDADKQVDIVEGDWWFNPQSTNIKGAVLIDTVID